MKLIQYIFTLIFCFACGCAHAEHLRYDAVVLLPNASEEAFIVSYIDDVQPVITPSAPVSQEKILISAQICARPWPVPDCGLFARAVGQSMRFRARESVHCATTASPVLVALPRRGSATRPVAGPAVCDAGRMMSVPRLLPRAGGSLMTVMPPQPVPAAQSAVIPVQGGTLRWTLGEPSLLQRLKMSYLPGACAPVLPVHESTAVVPYRPRSLVVLRKAPPLVPAVPVVPIMKKFVYTLSPDGKVPTPVVPRGLSERSFIADACCVRGMLAKRCAPVVDIGTDSDLLRKIKILARHMRDAAYLIVQRIDADREGQAAQLAPWQCARDWMLRQDVLHPTWNIIDPLVREGVLTRCCLESEFALLNPLQSKLSFKQKYEKMCELNRRLHKVKAISASRERVEHAQKVGASIVEAVWASIIKGYYQADRAGDHAHGYQRTNRVRSACQWLYKKLAVLPLDD